MVSYETLKTGEHEPSNIYRCIRRNVSSYPLAPVKSALGNHQLRGPEKNNETLGIRRLLSITVGTGAILDWVFAAVTPQTYSVSLDWLNHMPSWSGQRNCAHDILWKCVVAQTSPWCI